jgi:hypothetical protein
MILLFYSGGKDIIFHGSPENFIDAISIDFGVIFQDKIFNKSLITILLIKDLLIK